MNGPVGLLHIVSFWDIIGMGRNCTIRASVVKTDGAEGWKSCGGDNGERISWVSMVVVVGGGGVGGRYKLDEPLLHRESILR